MRLNFPSRARPRRRRRGLAGVRFLLMVAAIALVLRSFVFAPFSIPSESMMPQLLVGDYLFVSKWPYGWSRFSLPFAPRLFEGRLLGGAPRRGDVVVFRNAADGQDYIKRVIGLPGDRIRLRGGRLVLNGETVPARRIADFTAPQLPGRPCNSIAPGSTPDRPLCRYTRLVETLPGGRAHAVLDLGYSFRQDETGFYDVPEGRYFVMGDNRDDSADSRWDAPEGVGMIPADRLLGRASVVYFSAEGGASWFKPWTWGRAVRWSRIGDRL